MAARDDAASVARSIVATIRGETERPARPQPVTRAAIEAALAAFVREVIRPGAWHVRVPGTHAGGITHEHLLDVLAGQGRDFFANTVQLAQAVSTALRREWLSAGRLPSRDELRQTAEPALLDHVEKRFERGNGDVLMQPLTRRYAARKRALGRGSQPIGVASGELRRAVSRDAYVEWT